MLTRSKSCDPEAVKPLYEVNIDFDGASAAWHANKRRVGHQYVYLCGAALENGCACQRKPKKNSIHCFMHQKGKP
jgi:hypothetical protein